MRLYTRTGDDGTTSLFDGTRAPKNALRIELCGEADELSSAIGFAAVACEPAMRDLLADLQRRLFDLGADIATPRPNSNSESSGKADKVRRITPDDAAALESLIDDTCAHLPAMKYFILPGGGEAAARLHIARVICRRVERRCFSMIEGQQAIAAIGHDIPIYLNRLSDLLFALARRANQLAGVEDVPWLGRDG